MKSNPPDNPASECPGNSGELGKLAAAPALARPVGLTFETQGYGVNKPGAWRRLYGTFSGYARDFGWRAVFLGGGE